MNRTHCSACGSGPLIPILDLGQSPLADAYTARPDEQLPLFPLELMLCLACRLVQLRYVVPARDLFGTGYSFYSSSSAPLSAYHAAYARGLLATHRPLAERLVVEVGCNDGDMLRWFIEFPHVGVDPAPGPVKAARERGLMIIDEQFGVNTAHDIRDAFGQAGLLVANHVLAHVEDVADFLGGVSELLAPDGLAYIEVQYLPDLLLNNAIDLIYHEHRNFFSFTTLTSTAGRFGLHPLAVDLTDRQGGSMRVVFGRRRVPSAESARCAALRESERWLLIGGAYQGLQGRAERLRARLQDLVIRAAAGGTVVGYGAPAKLTTLLTWCALDVEHISWVTDTTRAKQGRYIPGTAIPIRRPDPNLAMPGVDVALLAAWNYTAPILRRHVDFMAAGGKWLVPIPAPTML